MITIKELADIENIPVEEHKAFVTKSFNDMIDPFGGSYDPEEHGYIEYLENDEDNLDEIFSKETLEGIADRDDTLMSVLCLRNNEYIMTYIVNTVGLDADLLKIFEAL